MSGSIIDVVTKAIGEALDDPNPLLAPLTGAGDVDAARAALDQAANDIANSVDLGDWLNDVDAWNTAIENLANAAFGSQDKVDQLLVRILQSRAARLAAALAVLGVITSTPDGGSTIDWARFRGLFGDTSTIINEAFWDQLLDGFGQPGDGRRLAVLIALMILAPQTILALLNGQLRVALQPPPTTRTAGDWRAFRTRTADWISATLPLGDPNKVQPNPESKFDWVSGIQPDFGATLAGRASRAPNGASHRTDFEVWLALGIEDDEWVLDLGSDWFVRVKPGAAFGFGRVDGDWHAAFRQFLVDASRLPGPADPVEATIQREPADGAPDILLGPPYDTRLEVKDVFAFLRVREQSPIVEIGFDIKGLGLVLTNRWWRTFGITDTLFPEGWRFKADVSFAWIEGKGFRLNLGSALEILIAISPPDGRRGTSGLSFQLHDIRLRIPMDAAAGEFRIRAEVLLHASVEIAPFLIATVDGPGVWIGSWKDVLGDPASERTNFGLLPPTGAGIQLFFGPISGGGYLERKVPAPGVERWSGLLTLGLVKFAITALGIWEEQPNGDTSFIAVLGVRFPGGIQLGFGFSITGIGGILGIDRRVDTDALRERLTSGAAGNVLFLEDPVRNAPAIIGDLAAIFPAQEGIIIAGPTFQLSWINVGATSFGRLDIGVVFEFTGTSLTKVVLLGSLKAETPGKVKDKALLKMRLDIVGILDIPKKTLEFDATLIDSKALEVFFLTGDASFRSSWGSNPYVLLSLGGFHPRFDPAPIVVPALTRLALTQTTPGFFGAGMHLRFEAYLAITTNTFQVGARVEAGLKLGPLNAVGFLSFDALVQFQPFFFEIEFSAGMAIRWNETTLAGVKVSGVLSGPGPLVLQGRACIELLFFDICRSGQITVGNSNQPAPLPAAEPLQSVAQELKASNLRGEGEDQHVRLRPRENVDGEALVAPNGRVVWSQLKVPLDMVLDMVDGQPVAAPQAVVAMAGNSTPTDELFAPGRYFKRTQDQALNLPAFERLQSGLAIGFSERSGPGTRVHSVKPETIRLPRVVPVKLAGLVFPSALIGAVSARTAAPGALAGAPEFNVSNPGWSAYQANGTLIAKSKSACDAFQRAQAAGGPVVRDSDVVKIPAF